MGVAIERKVPVYITLGGDTFIDYEHWKDEDIINEFKTYYNIKRKDFNIISVYDAKAKE